jgi:hypothetical protein
MELMRVKSSPSAQEMPNEVELLGKEKADAEKADADMARMLQEQFDREEAEAEKAAAEETAWLEMWRCEEKLARQMREEMRARLRREKAVADKAEALQREERRKAYIEDYKKRAAKKMAEKGKC